MHPEIPRLQNSKVDLGLELAQLHAQRGKPMSHQQIAAFCDCRVNAICEIERRALMRLRHESRIKTFRD